MNKAELIERVDQYGRKRYGVGFSTILLNDLIKDNLFPAATRKGNIGNRPIHDYGCRAYRRALQIVRLINVGIKTRDAQRVQLFLKGYGLDVSDADVRIPLRNEYVRGAKAVWAKARSGYLDKSKPIPQKHKQSLARQLGKSDARFEAAGLTPSLDRTVQLIRKAKGDKIDGDSLRKLKGRFEVEFQNDPSIDALAKILSSLISGMLVFDSEGQGTLDAARSRPVDTIEGIILHSNSVIYLRARNLFRNLDRPKLNAIIDRLSPSKPQEVRRVAANLLSGAIAEDPKWAALALTVCLMLASSDLPVP
jgi:hypothetical protein